MSRGPVSPKQVVLELQRGNARFWSGTPERPELNAMERRALIIARPRFPLPPLFLKFPAAEKFKHEHSRKGFYAKVMGPHFFGRGGGAGQRWGSAPQFCRNRFYFFYKKIYTRTLLKVQDENVAPKKTSKLRRN